MCVAEGLLVQQPPAQASSKHRKDCVYETHVRATLCLLPVQPDPNQLGSRLHAASMSMHCGPGKHVSLPPFTSMGHHHCSWAQASEAHPASYLPASTAQPAVAPAATLPRAILHTGTPSIMVSWWKSFTTAAALPAALTGFFIAAFGSTARSYTGECWCEVLP